MAKYKDILGMNARNRLYTSLNSAQARSICSSKYATKLLMRSKNIPTAEIYAILGTEEDVHDFDWAKLDKNFVIKPTNGHAGKGIIAFRKRLDDDQKWIDVTGKEWELDDIKLHCFDILEGQYSTHGRNHNVIVEERVPIHPKLLKYTYKGTPDIRIVVFNSVPIMGWLRLPTEESQGRANVSQGALGLGVDMATGVTTYATAHKNQLIRYLPGTKKKLNGIKIPYWKDALITAIKAANAANLIFCGVDIFVHPEKGPMVVELNQAPGLSIQVSNKAGLRRRLERVEDLNVLNPEHGVRIGQALFAEKFSDKIKAQEGITIINYREEVTVSSDDHKDVKTKTLINTGRFRSAISAKLAEELGLIDLEDLLWFQTEEGEGKRPVVEVKLKLKKHLINTTMIVSKKLNSSSYKIELGRKDISGFLVGDHQL